MATTFKGRLYASQRLAWLAAVAVASLACIPLSFAQSASEFRRTFSVSVTEPLTLDVELLSGDVQILYGREGQVSISGVARASAGTRLDDNFLASVLSIEQAGNHLTVRHVTNPPHPGGGVSGLYRIDVPYRTQVTSRLNQGKQNISGIMGPVTATTGKGDIRASYISKGLQAQVDFGNLDVQVIGEHVEAKTGSGNIFCARAEHGVTAETGEGDINLMVVGPSTATVKRGNGRINLGGARGSFIGSTDEGDLQVKAIPHDDWQLASGSGNIRLELPPFARFELEASTITGELEVDRDDIAKPTVNVRQLCQTINGGSKRIEVRTASGRIVIR